MFQRNILSDRGFSATGDYKGCLKIFKSNKKNIKKKFYVSFDFTIKAMDYSVYQIYLLLFCVFIYIAKMKLCPRHGVLNTEIYKEFASIPSMVGDAAAVDCSPVKSVKPPELSVSVYSRVVFGTALLQRRPCQLVDCDKIEIERSASSRGHVEKHLELRRVLRCFKGNFGGWIGEKHQKFWCFS